MDNNYLVDCLMQLSRLGLIQTLLMLVLMVNILIPKDNLCLCINRAILSKEFFLLLPDSIVRIMRKLVHILI